MISTDGYEYQSRERSVVVIVWLCHTRFRYGHYGLGMSLGMRCAMRSRVRYIDQPEVSKLPRGGESVVFGGRLATEVSPKVDVLPPRVGDKQ